MTVHGCSKLVIICDVLYVPEFKTNLLSVGKLAQQGMPVTFVRDKCIIGSREAPVAFAVRRDGLFRLSVEPAKAGGATGCGAAFVTAAACPERAMLWHRRFGHLGFANLGVLQRHGLVRGVDVPQDVFAKFDTLDCDVCQQTRPRQSRAARDSRSTHVLQLLHSDVCGPMQVPSMGGARYFVTVLDDFSKLSVVKCIAAKSDVPTVLPSMIQLLETQSGRRVQRLRSDRGGEYVNKALAEYASSKGILMELTAGYSPESNGAAERLNRTLIERTRAMLMDAGLPLALWGEAVIAACHVRNRSPVAGTRAGTPWGMFFGAVPDVSHLRVYGCKVLCHVPSVLRKKFDSVSYSGVLVGYGGGGHRVLVDGTRKVKVCRDAVFLEEPVSRADSSEPAPKRKSAEPGVDAKKNPGVGADVSPVDSSSNEDSLNLAMNQAIPEELPAEEQHAAEEPPSPAAGEEQQGQPAAEDAQTPEAPQRRYPLRDRRPPGKWYAIAQPAEQAQEDAAVAMVCSETPSSLAQAIASPAAPQWRQAMDEEMASLSAHCTWDLQEVPVGRKPIACRWVYALKRNEKGSIERYKARLVAKGFSQKPGADYGDIWAPVSQYKTLRCLLAFVAATGLELHQLDIKTAFLNGDIDEELYMMQPPGYQRAGDSRACRLRRALYGLKQASRAWHLKLKEFLAKAGFQASDADPCLFLKHIKTGLVFILVYVDDMLIAAPTQEDVGAVKAQVLREFEARDMGEAGLFLGMSIVRHRSRRLLWLHQGRYARDIVARFGMTEARAINAPMARETSLRRGDAGGQPTDKPYAEVVGSLMYLMTCTRPDLAQSVGALSRFVSDPRKEHWEAAVKVLRYVVGTLDLGLQYGGKTREVIGYCDADYAGDLDTRKSTTGYVWLMHGGAVSWRSVLQPTVALSTAEAEYMAAAGAAREALWLRKLLHDLGVAKDAPRVLSDSQSALALVRNPVVSQRSKHIDVLHHFVRERSDRGEIVLEYCSTEQMVADSLTKVVGSTKFVWCRQCMGLSVCGSSGS